jgi:hypothetical protein
MDPRARWALGYVALFVVFAAAAETETLGPIAAALAALTASSATFLMLPKSLKNLGFIQ